MTVQDNSIEFSYAYFTPKAEGTEGNVNKDKNVKKNAEHWLVKRIAKPSLRNIGYTICVLFQCAWLLDFVSVFFGIFFLFFFFFLVCFLSVVSSLTIFQ